MTRFLFVHKKKDRFVRVELAGSSVLVDEGHLGERETASTSGSAPPRREEKCGSPSLARKKLDQIVAKLMGESFKLSMEEEKAARPTKTKTKIAKSVELEENVREAPDDEARWLVLEDWLLEQDDARADLIRVEKTGQRGDAAQARGRIFPLLWGKKPSDHLISNLRDVDWRAGYLRRCSLTAPPLIEHLTTFANAPATALLSELDFSVESARVDETLNVLAQSPVVKSLRVLHLHLQSDPPGQGLPAKTLDAFTKLTSLHVAGHAMRFEDDGAYIDRLHQLTLTPQLAGELEATIERSIDLRALRTLIAYTWWVTRNGGNMASELATVINGNRWRMLTDLRVLGSDEDDSAVGMLRALTTTEVSASASASAASAASERAPLLPRLSRLSLGYKATLPQALRHKYGAKLNHLEVLELPDRLSI